MDSPTLMTAKSFAMTIGLLLLAACSAKTQEAQQITADELYAEAQEALSNRKWSDAITAFERFSLQFPTHPRVQEARYRLSEAYFGKKEYITSATEFARLASDFPAGPWADDARFKVCESYYKLSPKPPLDQQYTRGAIDHCQSLETYYPTSEYVPQAQKLVAELTNKLADKHYRNAEFYYKRGAIDSAILYYEMTLRDFPTTDFAARSLLRLFQAYTTLGYKEEAEAAKARLIKDYPASDAAKQVQGAIAKTQ